MGQPANSILEVRYNGTVNGQKVVSVLHWVVSTQWSADNLMLEYQNIYDQIKATGTFDITTYYLECCSQDYTLDTIDLQFVWPVRYVSRKFTSGGTGVPAVPCSAQNLSAVIEKYTILAGRKYRGSLHVPAIPDGAYTGGELEAAYVPTLADLAAAIKQQIAEDSGPGLLDPVIYHRGPNENPKHTKVANTVVMPYIRTMRRRTVGVGK